METHTHTRAPKKPNAVNTGRAPPPVDTLPSLCLPPGARKFSTSALANYVSGQKEKGEQPSLLAAFPLFFGQLAAARQGVLANKALVTALALQRLICIDSG